MTIHSQEVLETVLKPFYEHNFNWVIVMGQKRLITELRNYSVFSSNFVIASVAKQSLEIATPAFCGITMTKLLSF
ncbi:MAG: hypothetical protein UU81_C0039G0008 [Microgenomates group bacterium GW2011_GWC1_41_8]|uniref:Uncharacterized protein n=1 Tax=Candidatus Roizmanbacteria bacterium GW2011_GWB1_40_7 TaxID=1618482 RepID=A0A0G0VG60_9BACT|nr:MAG: hypothetical protein UU14_C0037G0024 [Candidatus Roizmanbacteria bacterium GW2011_GWB1_40_7]KKS23136.1 MAG: hypothetical protein UU81_C0039G0008 [Microgenomates group bacterium GW2011_GWC1_41_8]OGK49340.1 MAG: hypothetical protein A3A55_01120 [Candidatus Roizmanbacteria bacterium RIFCSPLOWO2_01_FULL_40_14]